MSGLYRKYIWLAMFGCFGSSLWGAAVIIAIEQTTMPDDEWQFLQDVYRQYEVQFAALGESDGFSIEVTDDAIRYVYDYEDAADYELYKIWKETYVDLYNDPENDEGIVWNVYLEGRISDESNPWRDVQWLPDVDVVDGNYLVSDQLGWLFAEDWDINGNFWAYAYGEGLKTWLYCGGDGFYYNADEAKWIWNVPGTKWAFEFSEDPTGDEFGFVGEWVVILEQPEVYIPTLEDIIIDEMILQNLPGVAVGTFKDGKIDHIGGYGVLDIDTGWPPVTPSTWFDWASISKPLTAVMAFQLMDADPTFALDDPVVEHVPYWVDLPEQEEAQITIRHLLNNRSGIHHYGSGRDDDGDGSPDNTYSYIRDNYHEPDPTGFDAGEAVLVFKNTGLDFTPGSEYLYTTFGFNLLGAAVDEASPNGYVEWAKDNIIEPLSIGSLRVIKTERTGYRRRSNGRLTASTTGSYEWVLPGGGWESNVVDLTKFAMNLEGGGLFANHSRMWATVPANDADNQDYRFGINGRVDGAGLQVSHGGAHNNLRTLMYLRPGWDHGIVIMAFAEWANTWRFIQRIDPFYGITWGNVDTSPRDECRSVMGSGEGFFAGTWLKTDKDVIIRRGYSQSGFFNEWKFLRDNGYYCDDFDANMVDGEVQWDGIFRKGEGSNGMVLRMQRPDFEQFVTKMEGYGQRIVDVETYAVNGVRYYAGLFRPGSGNYEVVLDLGTGEFGTRRDQLASQGLKLIDIEAYSIVSDSLVWAGVFVEGQDGLLNRNYNGEDFYDLYLSRNAAGWRLVDVEVYPYNGSHAFAGVWVQETGTPQYFYEQKYCDFMDIHTNWSARGYELLDMEFYGY